MKLFFKRRKQPYSYKEKVTIAVLLAVIIGANTVTIVKAASTWSPQDSGNLASVDPNGLVGCQAQPGFQCGSKNGQKVSIGFVPDLEALALYTGSMGPNGAVDNLLFQQIGSAPCVFGYSSIRSVTNVSTTNTERCWTIKYVCVSYCEPFDSDGKNSVPCSVTLCRKDSPVSPVDTDPNNQVMPSTK